ncbi:MAG: GIY-YIG nuclease family protein [Fimbriimonadaceae bacterium]|nr:GIY-YIG nuclease family protein [Alphaproteobacteria bacterium]
MSCGIYAIVNKTNGDRYVGQSVRIEQRWSEHRKDLRANKGSSPALQEAWNYFGEENFEFVILESCEEISLSEREVWHMSKRADYNLTQPYHLAFSDDDVDEDEGFRTPTISSKSEALSLVEAMIPALNQHESDLNELEVYLDAIPLDSNSKHLIESLLETSLDSILAASGSIEVLLEYMREKIHSPGYPEQMD